MGHFIEQIQKNNQLQQQILTEKQEKENKKELERKQRIYEKKCKQKDLEYKEYINYLKKQAIVFLNNYIENEYNKKGTITYENYLLNRKEIIKDLSKEFYKKHKITDINDKADIFLIIKDNFLKINKKYYLVQKEVERIELNHITEEALREQNNTSNNINKSFEIILDIISMIFKIIITIIAGFTIATISFFSNNNNRKK